MENPEQYFKDTIEPELSKKIQELLEEKEKLRQQTSSLSELCLSLQRRNERIVDQMENESLEFDKRVADQQVYLEKTIKDCEIEIEKVKEDIKADFAAENKILIENRKKFHHLNFNLSEKKEVDEMRKVLLAQEAKLKKEYGIISKQLHEKREQAQTEAYRQRVEFQKKIAADLQVAIEKAREEIKQEQKDTLRTAQKESKQLSKQVAKVQKHVVELRDRYNMLLNEANDLEMQLMEAKLVTQLTTPEQNQQEIQSLLADKEKLEDERLKARTKPEADGRRKLAQHTNLMKKKQNELNGFIKLNQIKQAEMDQLRALAMNVIEQRNAMMTFMNETITLLRKEIAANVNQKGLSFRTSELILCHVADDDQRLGRMFQGGATADPVIADLSEQLRFFEVLYSRFTGIAQPRKVEEA